MHREKNKGQSLLEVVMVSTVLAMALVAMASSAILSLKNLRITEDRSVARRLLNEEMEELKVLRDRDPESFFSQGSISIVQNDVVVENRTFDLMITSPGLVNGGYEITGTVTWEDSGKQLEVRESSILTRFQ